MQVEPWSVVEELAVAVGGRDSDVQEVVDRVGPAAVVDVLVAEIAARAVAPAGVAGIPIALEVLSGSEVTARTVSFVDSVLRAGADEATDLVVLRYEVVDLVRLVFRNRDGYESSSQQVRLPVPSDPGLADREARLLAKKKFDGTLRTMQAVIAAITAPTPGLAELATRFGSDKWGFLHWYTPHYHRHFQAMRFEPVRVLEIGIGGYDDERAGGGSLAMWQEYFPRGLVYGLDIFPKEIAGPRIRTVVGDQGDAAGLAAFAAEHGPFDIVIDDGSHRNEHVRTSFEALFPHVRPGGYYVIEDLQTSYWPEFGGQRPPGSSATTMGLLKELLDGIHRREYDTVDDDAAWAAGHPSDVFVTHNLAFLGKGINHEQGAPAWLRQGGAV
ncbi:class I SAM-dependent methyltransferase [Kutzneria sp. NPDC052558]|uniref:class I SAM-dependent methyltransferase n=1 Tax=Kutzneria sp. NPDC052558 TaxID=3364121 RepID=UPI0037C62DA2